MIRNPQLAHTLEALGAEVVTFDRFGEAAFAQALAGVARVYHLAGGGKVGAHGDAGLAQLRASNVAPLESLLRVARERPLERIVHFSSISSMGIQFDIRLDEDSPPRPVTPHEVVKLESERVALAAWERDRMPVVVLRPAQIYGPGDVRSDIPKLVRLARRGLVPLFGAGNGLVPWVFVSDVVDAALSACEREEALGRVYIVSDAESMRFGDVVDVMACALGRRRGGFAVPDAVAVPAIRLVETMAGALGLDAPFTRHRLASLSGRRIYSIDRARRELGYAPKVHLQEGMARTVRWYVEQRLV
jgi:nucleoside-diphosphate-sugar epimerase